MSVRKIVGWAVLGVTGIAAFALVLGFAVMWLWNWLVPELFHLPAIGYWQAVGLLVLSHLLFKGHTAGIGHRGRRDRRRWDRFANGVKGTLDQGGPQPEHGGAGG